MATKPKQSKMGKDATKVLSLPTPKRTGAEALAAVTGAEPQQPRARGRQPMGHVPWLVQVRPDQKEAIVNEAWRLMKESGAGHARPDASKMLRDIIDEWMAGKK